MNKERRARERDPGVSSSSKEVRQFLPEEANVPEFPSSQGSWMLRFHGCMESQGERDWLRNSEIK